MRWMMAMSRTSIGCVALTRDPHGRAAMGTEDSHGCGATELVQTLARSGEAQPRVRRAVTLPPIVMGAALTVLVRSHPDLGDGSVEGRMSIEPDTKDWTWVLERPCPECGFDAAAVAGDGGRGPRAGHRSAGYRAALARATPRCARAPTSGRRWSTPATCATCTGSTPTGSRSCSTGRPAVPQLGPGRHRGRGALRRAGPAPSWPTSSPPPRRRWPRRTTGSAASSGSARDGAATAPQFTVDSFARYYLHDIEHHLHDIA